MKLKAIEKGDVLFVAVEGNVDTGVRGPLVDLGKKRKPAIFFDLSGLRHINSIGCRDWAEAMSLLAQRHKVELYNCPVTFMDSCNLLPAMLGGEAGRAAVRTFQAPYVCTGCERTWAAALEMDRIGPDRKLPPLPCPKCGEAGRYELEPDDYLAFLGAE